MCGYLRILSLEWLRRWALVGALVLGGGGAAMGQVLIYEMEFDPGRGYNAPGLDGGYAIVPVAGGTGSFIFTFEDGGVQTYTEAANAGSYYAASTAKGEQKWVLQASVTSAEDSISGAYVAFGDARRKVRIRTLGAELEVKVAPMMKGEVVASSSAVDSTNAAVVGFASLVDWKNTFRRQLTEDVNRRGLDVAGATAFLADRLDAQGFNDNPPVSGTAVTITTTAVASGTVGSAYSANLSASGGTGSVTWSLQSGSSLPAGLTLSAAGVISGTPTAAGTSSFTVVAASGGSSDSQALTLTIGS